MKWLGVLNACKKKEVNYEKRKKITGNCCDQSYLQMHDMKEEMWFREERIGDGSKWLILD